MGPLGFEPRTYGYESVPAVEILQYPLVVPTGWRAFPGTLRS